VAEDHAMNLPRRKRNLRRKRSLRRMKQKKKCPKRRNLKKMLTVMCTPLATDEEMVGSHLRRSFSS
tara:strand:+ start:71 stop:268 length:198 start_codon:yes stop_codon:yes gene_type:complete